VFTTTESLAAQCSSRHKCVINLPNVVDLDHFLHAHDDAPLPKDIVDIPVPRIAYVGVLSDFKVDFALLLAVARARLDWQWVLIGEEREGQESQLLRELAHLPNVHLLGHKPYAVLPDYLRGVNASLLPTCLNNYTRAMFPMKYFEYLAAGTPIISTPLEFTKHRKGGMEIASDPTGFIAAIERQLKRGRFTRDESIALVGDNTWQERLTKMLVLIEES